VAVILLTYLAITRVWTGEKKDGEPPSLVWTSWGVQGGLGMMSGVRLVAWKLKGDGVSAKVAIPVILVLALVSFAIWIAGALMIGESDDSKMKRG